MTKDERIIKLLELHGRVKMDRWTSNGGKYTALLARRSDGFWIDYWDGQTKGIALNRLYHKVRERLWRNCKEIEKDAYR